MSRYRKFIAAAVGAAAVVAQAAASDGAITNDEWVKIGVAAVVAVVVLLIPNAPKPDEAVELLRAEQARQRP